MVDTTQAIDNGIVFQGPLRHTAASYGDEDNVDMLHDMANRSVQDLMEDYNGSDYVMHGVELNRPNLLKQSTHMVVILSIAYLIVFLLAVINNILVITVIYKNQQLRTVTNYFLANLAVADITVSFIVLPITLLSNLFTEWRFGAFLCKAIPYLQAVAVAASVSTLAAVAVERYLAIFCPQKKIITSQRAFVIILFLWLVPVAIQVPWALFHEQRTYTDATNQHTACVPNYPSNELERGFFLGVVFLTCYIMPLCFITVFYSMIGIKVWRRNVSGIRGSKTERNIQQQKIRIVRMLVTVAVVFALAWLPLYSIRMRIYYGGRMSKQERDIVGHIIQPIAQWVGAATSAINPFVYCYFSEQFRKGIMELLGSSSCCSRLQCNKKGSERVPTTAVTV